MQYRGIIALDIDGTLTDETHRIEPVIVEYLTKLHQDGWLLIFITGRPYAWGYRSLHVLNFPYYLSVQNGAILLEMPKVKIIKRKYLDGKIIKPMEHVCEGEPTDFVIYCGMEENDRCYYRPEKFAPDLRHYVEARCKYLEEDWVAVPSFEPFFSSSFASVKCFGLLPSIERIASRMEGEIGLHAPPIRDPFKENYYVAQATHAQVNKGLALRDFAALFPEAETIIAAGDDNNDLSMLEHAHIKIVMANAPKPLLAIADVIAPPASQQGILTGLKHAVAIALTKDIL